MTQPTLGSLFDGPTVDMERPATTPARPLYFDGPEDDASREARLGRQLADIRTLMLDGVWRTLEQIHQATGHPAASISAQLRHLRKPRFGGYEMSKRHLGHGLYEYHVAPKSEASI